MFLSLKIFEMMDAKARQDCIKEIDLLKVRIFIMAFPGFFDLRKKLFSGWQGSFAFLWQIKLI